MMGSLVAFLAANVTRKFAYVLALIASMGAAFIALKIAIATITSGLTMALPNELVIPFTWILPANLSTCISAYMAARSAVWLYKWKINIELAAATA